MTISVKLLTGRVGNGSSHMRGDVIDVELAEASRMVAAGQCRPDTAEAKAALEKFQRGEPGEPLGSAEPSRRAPRRGN